MEGPGVWPVPWHGVRGSTPCLSCPVDAAVPDRDADRRDEGVVEVR